MPLEPKPSEPKSSLGTTHVLIALNVLVFAAMVAFGGVGELRGFSTHTLLVFGSDQVPLVLRGQWYRPFTSMFVHLNAIHLGVNMMALYQVGVPLERFIGKGRYMAVYIVAGLAGSAASIAWHFRTQDVSAGASGAITGLIGGAAVVAHLVGPGGVPLRNAMIRWLVTVFALGIFIHADNAAHLGGLVGGAVLTFVFLRLSPRLLFTRLAAARAGAERAERPGVETLVLVVLFALAFGDAARRRDDAWSVPELVNRGVDAAKQGDGEGAIALYRRALELDPQSGTAWYDLGLALGRKGEHDEAVSALEKAVSLGEAEQARSALVHEHTRFAFSLRKEGKLDEAEAAARRALAADERSADALVALGVVQEAKKDLPAAIATFRAALALEPDDVELKKQLAGTLVNRGVELARAGSVAEAVPLYREAIALDESDAVAYFDLGLALRRQGDLPGARAALERSAALRPDRDAYEVLAAVHGDLGDEEKAAKALEAARALP